MGSRGKEGGTWITLEELHTGEEHRDLFNPTLIRSSPLEHLGMEADD